MKISVTRLYPQYELIETGYTYTKQQIKYIDVIERYKLFKKQIPSIRTIAYIMGVKSPATVHDMLNKLKEKGYNYKEL